MATLHFIGFVVAPELVWLLLVPRRDTIALAACAVVALVVAALAPLAIAQRGTGHADYISHGDLTTRLLQLPKQFLVGYASPGQLVSTVPADGHRPLTVSGSMLLPARRRGFVPLFQAAGPT
jgi:hypothetical protein